MRKRKHEGLANVSGKKIRYYRRLEKMSYQKLSDKLMLCGVDIQKPSLVRIENGTRTIVDYELCAIAKCLKVTTNDLLEDYTNSLE